MDPHPQATTMIAMQLSDIITGVIVICLGLVTLYFMLKDENKNGWDDEDDNDPKF